MVIAPKTIICELQSVVIADDVLNEENKKETNLINNLKIDERKQLNEQQLQEIKNLLLTHVDVFSKQLRGYWKM